MPRENLRDRPVLTSLVYLENHAITDGEFSVLLTLLLEPSAKRGFVRLPRVGADMPYPACPLEHDALLARQLVPSWRIESHQGSSFARFSVIS